MPGKVKDMISISVRMFEKEGIIPIAAFALGAFASNLTIEDVLVMTIVILILIIMTRFIYMSIVEIGKEIFEPKVVKMQYLYYELQDLYDRDYLE